MFYCQIQRIIPKFMICETQNSMRRLLKSQAKTLLKKLANY